MRRRYKVKSIIALFGLMSIFLFVGCASVEDDSGFYGDESSVEERIVDITGHEIYCDCADCWAVGEAIEMIDMLREDHSYYGIDAITVERDEEGYSSDGIQLNDFYELVLYYNVRTSEPIPEESDVWYITQGWQEADNKIGYQKDSSRGYRIEIEAYDGPDLGGTDYVVY